MTKIKIDDETTNKIVISDLKSVLMYYGPRNQDDELVKGLITVLKFWMTPTDYEKMIRKLNKKTAKNVSENTLKNWHSVEDI